MTQSNVEASTVDSKMMTQEIKGEVSFLPTDIHSRMLMGWFDANAGVQKEEAPVDLGPLPTEPTDCQSQLWLQWFAARAQDPQLFLEPQPAQSRPTDCLSQMLMGWFEAKENETPVKEEQVTETPGFNALLTAYQDLCNDSGKTFIPTEWLKTWFSLPLMASKPAFQPAANGNAAAGRKSAILADLDQQLSAFGLRSVETALIR